MKQKKKLCSWNLPLILQETGGPVDLHAKLVAAGHDIEAMSVRAWFRRGQIPADWIAAIIGVVPQADPRKWIMENSEDIW